jgi:hypothetical protein
VLIAVVLFWPVAAFFDVWHVQIEQLQEREWAATAAKTQAQHKLTTLAEEAAEGRGNADAAVPRCLAHCLFMPKCIE